MTARPKAERQTPRPPADDLPPCMTWTVRQTASALGVSDQLVRGLIREGYLPVIRLGRRVLVRRSTVERLLAEPQGEDARITQLVTQRRELIQEQTRPRTHAQAPSSANRT